MTGGRAGTLRRAAARAWLGTLLVLGSWAAPAAAAEASATCKVGVGVAALYDLEPAEGSFGAGLWLWSLCPTRELAPLARIVLPTARPGVELGPLTGEAVADGYYESRQVRGLFRHRWDMRRYPFDSQRLAIRLEEAELGAARLTLAPDTSGSFVAPAVAGELGEWRVGGLRVTTGVGEQVSSYGFPEASPSSYAWLEAEVVIERRGILTFVKLTLPVLAAALFVVLCLHFDPRLPSTFPNQVSILVVVLFSIIVNHRRSDDVIGDVGRLTLVTEIHLATILLTILVAALAFRDLRRVERQQPVRYPDRTAIGATAAGYLGVVTLMILSAALGP